MWFKIGSIWKAKTENKYCKFFEYKSEPSQMNCQSLCLNETLCVGIAYGQKAKVCQLCHYDALDSNSGYVFYRREGTHFILWTSLLRNFGNI